MVDLHYGDYRQVLMKAKADLIITSPPYNIGSARSAKTGYRKYGLYDPKSYRSIQDYSDSLPEGEYQESQVKFMYWCYRHLKQDGTLIYNHKPRRKDGRMIHPMSWLGKCKSMVLMEEIIWDRGSTHNHSNRMFWPHTERLYVFRKEGESYRLHNTDNLAFRSDVWRINRCVSGKHNAPFPEELVEMCLMAYGFDGCRVMDPFSGSGTTAAVCKRMGFDCIASERLKKYVRVAKRRIEECA